jgi:hypothetical protein
MDLGYSLADPIMYRNHGSIEYVAPGLGSNLRAWQIGNKPGKSPAKVSDNHLHADSIKYVLSPYVWIPYVCPIGPFHKANLFPSLLFYTVHHYQTRNLTIPTISPSKSRLRV